MGNAEELIKRAEEHVEPSRWQFKAAAAARLASTIRGDMLESATQARMAAPYSADQSLERTSSAHEASCTKVRSSAAGLRTEVVDSS